MQQKLLSFRPLAGIKVIYDARPGDISNTCSRCFRPLAGIKVIYSTPYEACVYAGL